MKPDSNNRVFDFSRTDFTLIDTGVQMVENFFLDIDDNLLDETMQKEIRFLFIDYMADSRAGSPTLKESRQDLEAIVDLAGKLQERLKNLGGPAEKALYDAVTRISSLETKAPEIVDDLRALRIFADNALKHTPSTGRGQGWKTELVPERELVKGLARIYEQATGKSAKDGISQDRRADTKKGETKYFGDFFELVEKIFTFLGIPPRDNSNLGVFLFRVLSD